MSKWQLLRNTINQKRRTVNDDASPIVTGKQIGRAHV